MESDRHPANSSSAAAAPVVIVGGGFAGLYTALSLAESRRHPPILLIEPQERFLFLPLLYELLSGELRRWEIAPRYDALLAGKGVGWLQDRVDRIDASQRLVHTAGGRSLPYRRLVLASGGHPEYFGVPGADIHSLGFRNLDDVERLQTLLEKLRRSGRPLQRLAVVGAGPSGVELACKLADLVQGCAVIELIEQGPTLLPQARAFSREQAEKALRQRDVRLRTHTAVTRVDADRLHLCCRSANEASRAPVDPDEILSVDGVIWTAGLSFRPPLISPDPRRDRRGRLCCEGDLSLIDQSSIFVAGDLAHLEGPDGDPLPGTAQVAFQQAPLLAANLLRSLADEPLESFQWKDLGEMLSLGKGDACLTAAGLTLAGPAAFRLRQLAYLSRMPGLTHTRRVAAGWLADWKP